MYVLFISLISWLPHRKHTSNRLQSGVHDSEGDRLWCLAPSSAAVTFFFSPCLVRYEFSSIVSSATPSLSFHRHTHLFTCPLVHVFKVHVWKAHSLTCTHTLVQNHSSHSSASQDFSKEQQSFANQINTTWEVWEQCKALYASVCLFTFAQKDWGETVRSDLLLLFLLIPSHYGKSNKILDGANLLLTSDTLWPRLLCTALIWINWVESHQEQRVTQMVPLSHWLEYIGPDNSITTPSITN